MSTEKLLRGEQDPRRAARKLVKGFVYHDRRERDQAIEAFAAADRFQFQHVDSEVARRASIAYVDALWTKDDVEDSYRVDGKIQRDALVDADWTPVRRAFERRASLIGIDSEYAELSTVGWRRHKTGGDYWTPLMRAQMYELRAALDDEEYPHKKRHGHSGFGPEAGRYLMGVELHDIREFEETVEVMVPYFERIAHGHENRSSKEWRS